MKINKLAIQNFRNHTSTILELDRLNILVGSNNSGKSSILAAIEWALTGRNMWTDKAGRGAGDLVTRGAKGCQVGLELDGFGGVVRSMPPHTLAAGRHQGVQEAQAAIHNHLGADEKLLQLVLNAGAFTSLAPADQKAFLFGLSGVSFGRDQVTAATLAYLLKGGAKEDQAKEAANRVKSLFPRGIEGSPGVLEAMGKKAREMRKETKKDLERTRAALEETVLPNLPEGIELEDKDEVAGQIADLDRELSQWLKARGAKEAAGKSINHLQGKISALEGEIAGLAQTWEAKTASLKGADVEGLQQEDAHLKEQLEQVDKLVSRIGLELAGIKGGTGAKQELVQRLSGFNGLCPLAPEHVSCDMPVHKVKELATRLEAEVAADLQKAAGLERDSQRLQGEKAGIRDRIARLERDLAARTGLEQEIAVINDTIGRRDMDLAGLKRELTAQLDAAQAPGADPEELDRLQERITKGREMLRIIEVAQHGRQHAAQLQTDLTTLQQEVNILEHLVKALGPDGVKQALLGDRLAGFTNQLNNNLAAYTDGRYHLTWAEDYTPAIRHSGHDLPVRLLSKSEQFRVGVAVQAAIAKTAGLKFLAVDEVDILDQDNRDLLTGSLLEALDEFEQILLLCTVGDVEPQSPGLPGVKMFRVEAGAVTEIKGGDGSD